MAVSLKFSVLASGSKGNASLIEAGDFLILLDNGLTGVELSRRMENLGRKIEDIGAVLVTHHHSDHSKGLKVLTNKISVPLYCTAGTAQVLVKEVEPSKINVCKIGDKINLGSFAVESFAVPHDAKDAVGWNFCFKDKKLSYATDLGFPCAEVVKAVKGADALVLEANHDLRMLAADIIRPEHRKARIRGNLGHLSNEQAIAMAEMSILPNAQHLVLAHLSEDCNSLELVEHKFSDYLTTQKLGDIKLNIASQTNALNWLEVG